MLTKLNQAVAADGYPDGITQDGNFLVWHPKSQFIRNALGTQGLLRRHNDGAIQITVQDIHCNQNGVMHGGCISSLMDVVMAFRISDLFGCGVATINLNLNFMVGAVCGEVLLALPSVGHAGRKIGFCNSTLWRDDRIIATAQANFVPVRR